MKRISIYIIALVTLGAAALTSCKKEFNGDAPTFTATLEYNEKTQFTGGHLYWSENDQVAIYGNSFTPVKQFNISPNYEGYQIFTDRRSRRSIGKLFHVGRWGRK